MKFVAVICEYNPFHKGHKLQIDMIKEKYPDSYIISLMSGSFVQRGSFAILPKYERAKAAVLCGADLVLELPYPYSCGSAEFFATGAIRTLKKLNCIDVLCFGSESGNVEKLCLCAERCISEEFCKFLEKRLDKSKNSPMSYAEVQSECYKEMFGEDILLTSNDILALEYLKAMGREDFHPELFVIKRETEYSATVSREMYFNCSETLNDQIPESCIDILKEYRPVTEKSISPYIIGTLRFTDAKQFKKYAEMGGGFESRICNAAENTLELEGLYRMCSVKKYTNARIRRMILYSLLKIKEKDLKEEPIYTQLLAMKASGSKTFKEIVKGSKIRVLTKAAHYKRCGIKLRSRFEKAAEAEKLYFLAFEYSGNSIDKRIRSPYIHK